ncbi:MAG: MurR/RpiR family transcriptional regulator [Lachnospiraceae bacterium]|nr:MurR/RpiR family transcriptional regulator [Lachnospiraceae bacterium]MDY3222238.1 MurR/RpiR family transcriptional regulator [Lachnospiraceae bacterium]
MATTILDSITEQYNSLTRSSRKLADYIFSNTTEVQYMSITSLAESSGVSEATITRFCRGLGLYGYNDFKLALAKSERLNELGDPPDSPQSVNSEDDFDTLCRKLHASNIISLNETLELLNKKALYDAISLMADADHVFCFGQGGGMVMAMEAWARFSTATNHFIHIGDSHMQAIATALSGPKDAILFFSYSGSTKDMEDVLKLARQKQTPIILVTHFPKSRAAEFADVILQCGYNESPLQSGSIAAKVGQLFLIECLFYGYCQKNPEHCTAAKKATAQAIANKLL